jgi:hypothetical protein
LGASLESLIVLSSLWSEYWCFYDIAWHRCNPVFTSKSLSGCFFLDFCFLFCFGGLNLFGNGGSFGLLSQFFFLIEFLEFSLNSSFSWVWSNFFFLGINFSLFFSFSFLVSFEHFLNFFICFVQFLAFWKKSLLWFPFWQLFSKFISDFLISSNLLLFEGSQFLLLLSNSCFSLFLFNFNFSSFNRSNLGLLGVNNNFFSNLDEFGLELLNLFLILNSL